MLDGVWAAVAGSAGQRIVDCVPSPTPNTGLSGESATSICTAWVGASVDQRRGEYLLCANGGHADYPGNECYALSLRAATPAWRRISSPTPNASMPQAPPAFNEGDGRYSDGRPRAMHNTFQCFGDGRVWMPAMNSVTSEGGGFVNRQVSFNRDMLGAASTPAPYSTNPWNDYGVLSGLNTNVALFGVGVFHRYRHRAYGLAGNSANSPHWWYVNTIGPSIGTGSAFTSGQSFGHWGSWVVCAHDLDIIVAGDHLRSAITVLDCAANTWTQVANVTGSGYFAAGAGGVYVAKNRTIGIGNPVSLGNTIYKLQIPTTTSGGRVVYNPSGQWVWSNSTPGGATITLHSSGNRAAYSKWNIVEDMGDGRSAIVYCGGISNPTYVYKIPASGL